MRPAKLLSHGRLGAGLGQRGEPDQVGEQNGAEPALGTGPGHGSMPAGVGEMAVTVAADAGAARGVPHSPQNLDRGCVPGTAGRAHRRQRCTTFPTELGAGLVLSTSERISSSTYSRS